MKIDLLARYLVQGQVKDIEIWSIDMKENKKAMRLQVIHDISKLNTKQIWYFTNIRKENLYFKPVSDLQAVLLYQAHIFLEKVGTLEKRTRLQKLLQQYFGSDPASTDWNHARRLPNTLNWKCPDKPVLRIIKEIK